MSFTITSILDKAASSKTVAVSSTATGASFTAVTVIVKVPTSVNTPSDMVYVIVSVPLKFTAGV